MSNGVLGRVVLGAALVAALVRLPATTSAVRVEARRGEGIADVQGIPVAPGMPEGTAELFARVRSEVPPDEPVRLVVRDTSCVALPLNAGAGATFWAQYHLLPRPLTCDPNARWWVFLGTAPGGAFVPPAGSESIAVRPTLVLVRLPGPR